MNSWIPKNRIVKFASITALLSVVIYFGGLYIVYRETNDIENNYHSTESDSYKESEVEYIKSVTEANKDSIQTLQDFFIQKGDEAKFIEQIEGSAKNSGITFVTNTIDVKSDDSSSFKEDLDVNMNISGSWQDIMSFIDKLGGMPFGVSVDNLNLSSDKPGNWSGTVDYVVFRDK